jgi:hypothetical protein
MQSNSIMKAVLAVVLCVSMLATGCTAQWISVALADLPVLTQMALNIAALVATLQSGKQLNPAEAAAIQNISAEAGKDLTLLQMLYNQYKANPETSKLQEIQSVIGEINQKLPALLQSAHINDPALATRIAAGVDLILTTVTSFSSLIPHTAAVTSRTAAAQSTAVPKAKDLKKRWNQQVCAPTGNVVFDSALAACVLK